MQFHLINTTILFLSREGFRRGCLRVESSEAGAGRRVLALALLTVPIGAALSAGVTLLLLRTHPDSTPDFRAALVMQGEERLFVSPHAQAAACTRYSSSAAAAAADAAQPLTRPPAPSDISPAGAAAFIEICSEPLYILASTRLLFGLRVGVDTAAMVAKSAVILALVRTAAVPPALAFSWAQLAYAAVVLLGYGGHFALRRRGGGGAAEEEEAAPDGPLLDREKLRLCGTFTLQVGGERGEGRGARTCPASLASRPARPCPGSLS